MGIGKSVRSTVLSLACAALISGNAFAATPKPVHVPAGDLSLAIETLAKQLSVDVIYASSALQGLKTTGVNGDLEPVEAFRKLVEGTSLNVREQKGSILISPKPNTPPSTSTTVPPPLSATPFPSDTPVADMGEETSNSDVPAGPPIKGLPEITVRGFRNSLNADIERTKDDVQPYVVFSGDEIRGSMATNIEDFLKNRLPMNTSSSTNAQSTRSGSNISSFNLRGLGADETLVLINGRRRPGVSNITRGDINSNFGQPDVNGIPLTAIERIEVLPATAAGIYGGGATGGVINIILKTDFKGLDVTASFANTFDTDSTIKTYSINGGMALEEGRTNISVAASFSEQNNLLVRDRDFVRRARELQYRNDPASFESGFSNIPTGYTTNIASTEVDCLPPDFTSCTRRNLVLDEGLVDIGSGITHIPVGYSGNLQDLIANAGRFNLDLANDINNASRSLQNAPKNSSINFTINRTFTEKLSLFANVGRTENNGVVISAGLPNTAYIAADAPNNPFTTDIQVAYPLPGLSFEQVVESETLDGLIGAAYKLPHNWSAQLEASWGRSRTSAAGGAPLLEDDIRDPPETGPVVRSGAISDIGNGTLDVLRDLNQSPLDLSPYALPYPNNFNSPSDTIGRGYALRLSGPIKKLPAGNITLTGLIEHRTSEAKATVQQAFVGVNGADSYFYYPSRKAGTDSYYLETYIPLVSSQNEKPWMKTLELQASVRRDDNSTESVPNGYFLIPTPDERPDDISYTSSSVAATGYTVGFRASPIYSVALRASFSHGFLPPSIAQIGQTTTQTNSTTVGFYPDPLRLFEDIGLFGPATIVLDGNPDLKPELSDSISAGLIFKPPFAEDLRLSVDYTQIKKTNEISGIDYSLLLERPDLFPGRVVRGPELGDGLPGPVIFLDTSLINIDQTLVKALDFQIDYSIWTARYGSFYLHAVATNQLSYSRRYTPELPLLNSVGFKDGPLKWRGNMGLDWNKGSLWLGWNMQYYDSYLVYGRDDGQSSIDYNIRVQGSDRIPKQYYHDLSFKYDAGASWSSRIPFLKGVMITGGIQNVFDKSPPIDALSSDAGYSTYGDPRLRRYTLQITKSFSQQSN